VLERVPDDAAIGRAVEVLRAGGLVAFPTETVYGLGADATSATALDRLFTVKGRPRDHPVIVHLPEPVAVERWAAEVPEDARALAREFWPGPLTLVLRRLPHVLDAVTGGRPTVGLRVPAQPVALALLRAFGGGLAAPSANRFGRVSPTTAAHVREDLGADVGVILDGGPCAVGVESTIVDCAGAEPVILRPGGVPREAVEAVLGKRVPMERGVAGGAPGTLAAHYRPQARVEIVTADAVGARRRALSEEGRSVGVLVGVEAPHLYARLREADAAGFDVILAVLPDEVGLGAAVADRLRRAAAVPAERRPDAVASERRPDAMPSERRPDAMPSERRPDAVS
jgi:L-threonylcarbamoyladenylate synthase